MKLKLSRKWMVYQMQFLRSSSLTVCPRTAQGLEDFDRLDAFLKRTEPKPDPEPRKGKRRARRNA